MLTGVSPMGVAARGRAATAAAAPSISLVDGGFDNAGLWTLARCAITSSALVMSGISNPFASGNLSAVPPDGTYRCQIVVTGWTSGSFCTFVLDFAATNASVSITGITGNGTYFADVAVAGATLTTARLSPQSASNYSITAASVTKIA
jgi:hypothetical protein